MAANTTHGTARIFIGLLCLFLFVFVCDVLCGGAAFQSSCLIIDTTCLLASVRCKPSNQMSRCVVVKDSQLGLECSATVPVQVSPCRTQMPLSSRRLSVLVCGYNRFASDVVAVTRMCFSFHNSSVPCGDVAVLFLLNCTFHAALL